MKKYIILAAAALATLASCNSIETEKPTVQEEISFKAVAYKGQTTKAPINNSYYAPTDPHFGIFAYWNETANWNASDNSSASEYMNDVKIEYGDNGDGVSRWQPGSISGSTFTANTYYWPITGKLTFIGYTPYEVSADYDKTKNTLTISDYQPSATIKDQYDVMYSTTAKDLTSNTTNYDADGQNTTTYNGVPVVFKHALSQVIFQVKDNMNDSNIKFEVSKVEVTNIINKGTLNVKNDAVATDDATNNLFSGWTIDPATKADYTPYSFTTTASDYGQDATTTLTAFTGDSNALLILPQAFGDEALLKVTYTVTDSRNNVPITTTKELKINSQLAKIEGGKKYYINILLQIGKIYFSPDVEDWTAGNSTGSDYKYTE